MDSFVILSELLEQLRRDEISFSDYLSLIPALLEIAREDGYKVSRISHFSVSPSYGISSGANITSPSADRDNCSIFAMLNDLGIQSYTSDDLDTIRNICGAPKGPLDVEKVLEIASTIFPTVSVNIITLMYDDVELTPGAMCFVTLDAQKGSLATRGVSLLLTGPQYDSGHYYIARSEKPLLPQSDVQSTLEHYGIVSTDFVAKFTEFIKL